MQVVFNSQERTLRELVTLSASAGWKVTKVSRTTGSLFGYLIAVPVGIPEKVTQGNWPEIKDGPGPSPGAISMACKTSVDTAKEDTCIQEQGDRKYRSDLEVIERASSRCGTPTFGSNMRLSSVQEALTRFGGGIIRKSRGITKTLSTPTYFMHKEPPPVPLKPALTLSSSGANSRKKTKPSPLSIVPVRAGPSSPGTPSLHTPSSATIPPSSARRPSLTSQKLELYGSSPSGHTHSNSHSQQGQSIIQSPAPKKSIPRRLSLANLRPTLSQSRPPPPPLPTFTFTRQPPASPNTSASPSVPVPKSLPRRLSHAHLSHAAAAAAAAHVQSQLQASQAHGQGLLAPSFIPIRASSIESSAESVGISSLGRSGSNLPGSTGNLPAPVTPQRSIPRKSSFAQLPLPSLRTRSGTVTGGPSVVDPSNSHSLSPFQNLVWGSRKHDFSTSSPGASVSKSKSCGPFPARIPNTESLGIRSTLTHDSEYCVPEFGSGGVLATAARIERGEFGQGNEPEGDDTMI